MTIAGRVRQGHGEGERLRGIEVGGHMYVNSGGSPVNVSSGNPHHPGAVRFRRLPLSAARLLGARARQHARAPTLLLSKSGMSDSHGIASVWFGRHLWVMDRHANVAEIIDTCTGPMGGDHRARRRGERRSGARPGGSLAARRSAVRGAARLGAAQRRSAQRHRQHAGPRRHRGETWRTQRRAGGDRAVHQSVAAAGAGTRRARPSRPVATTPSVTMHTTRVGVTSSPLARLRRTHGAPESTGARARRRPGGP